MKNQTEIKLINYLNDHWYLIQEDINQPIHAIASVTTKLGIERKQFLERWRGEVGNKNADEKMYESQQKGKRIHHAFFVYLNGGTVIYQPWEHPVYSDEDIEKIKAESPMFFMLKNQDEMIDLWKLQKFEQIVKPEIIATERIVYSIPDNEAGTLDFAFKIKKGVYPVNGSKGLNIPETGIYIGDLKTGNQVDEGAYSQISVYAKCFSSLFDSPVAGGIILHTSSKNRGGIEGLGALVKTSKELREYYQIYKSLASVWKARNPNAGPKVMKFPSLIKKEN